MFFNKWSNKAWNTQGWGAGRELVGSGARRVWFLMFKWTITREACARDVSGSSDAWEPRLSPATTDNTQASVLGAGETFVVFVVIKYTYSPIGSHSDICVGRSQLLTLRIFTKMYQCCYGFQRENCRKCL